MATYRGSAQNFQRRLFLSGSCLRITLIVLQRGHLITSPTVPTSASFLEQL
jgi:hypothetical protein